MGGIEIDEQAWPLITMTWPERSITDADLDAFIAKSRVHLLRGQHVVLHLAEHGSGLVSRQRRRMAQYVKDNEALLRKSMLAGAIVVKHPVMRAMVIAINWLAPAPFPQRLFAKREDAEAWLTEQLAAAGLSLAQEGAG